MKIGIRNIGPIHRADIELAPLTVFIGPNNSGKSVAATILYSMTMRAVAPEAVIGSPEQLREHIVGFLATGKPWHTTSLPPRIINFLIDNIDNTIREYLRDVVIELERTTGTTLTNLCSRKATYAAPPAISITSENPPWSGGIDIGDEDEELDVHVDESPEIDGLPMNLPDLNETSLPPSSGAMDTLSFMTSLLGPLYHDQPVMTYYLPAARSGILQSHKALAGTAIRRFAQAGRSASRSSPAMNGIVADFLAEITELNTRNFGHFGDEAEKIEQEIIRGEITLAGEPYPEVVFREAGGEYSTSQTSSMVSELAPVVLYLRHLLEPGDLLIIEEPEAHLHPATQVAFARCLVRLVNRGLKVCLTTHSEFFLQQINNAIMASTLSEEHVGEAGGPAERLDGDKVAAYFFEPTSDGTVVQRLPIDPKEGIPEVSFDAVTEKLYNEAIALDRSISGDE